jgi:hypothetical protein
MKKRVKERALVSISVNLREIGRWGTGPDPERVRGRQPKNGENRRKRRKRSKGPKSEGRRANVARMANGRWQMANAAARRWMGSGGKGLGVRSRHTVTTVEKWG